MGIIKELSSLPRRVQPVKHILSRERRHREMMEREDKFERFLEAELKKRRKKMTDNLWAMLAGILFCLPATLITFYRAWKEQKK